MNPDSIKKIVPSLSVVTDIANEELVAAAKEYIKIGLKIIPCNCKQPTKRVKSVTAFRRKPINDKNVDFYFNESNAQQIAILTGDKLEVIDIDCKYDLTGVLHTQIFLAIRYTLPEVWDKIVIAKTAKNGYHIYYKCHQIASYVTLAERIATPEEKSKGERRKVLIETKGEGCQIIAAPSPGYEWTQGDAESINFITIEERAMLLAICKSFDLIGTPVLKGISKVLQNKETAPWNVFNKEHDYKWILNELTTAGWEVTKEDDEKIFLLRPGSLAKSSGSIWISTGILYLFSTSTEFEAGKPYSAFGVYCQLKYDGDVKACAKDLAEQGIGVWSYDEGEFHEIDSKNKVAIKYSAILDWLKEVGFLKYRYSHHEYYIVQVIDKIVCISDTDRIKKIFGDYIKGSVDAKVYNFFLPRLGSVFSKETLITQLEELNENDFIESTDKIGWVYFQNAAIKVTGSEIEFKEYSAIEGYVWEKNIIKRNFKLFDHAGDTAQFVNLISGNNPAINLRFQCAFGYLLHKYKDPANPKVIILNDEFYDEHNDFEPQGGTGKGLCIKFLSHFRNTYSVDGKRFNFNKTFLYQGLNLDTELMAIEDAAKGFEFEQLFSSITEGFIVEKKGKDEFTIPFDKAPKLLITTNYAIKGSSSSHARRRYELEVSAFFSHKKRPIDHFGKRFFTDWDLDEWSRFDNYMVQCLQLFLLQGLPEQLTINLEKKRLIQETSRDFVNWIDDLHKNNKIPSGPVTKEDFMGRFTEMYRDYANPKFTQAKFTKWLNRWCESNRFGLDSSNSFNGKMCYNFRIKALESSSNSYELLENETSYNLVNLVENDQNLVENDGSTERKWKEIKVDELF